METILLLKQALMIIEKSLWIVTNWSRILDKKELLLDNKGDKIRKNPEFKPIVDIKVFYRK